MKLYEMQTIAEKNRKTLILAKCSYVCFAGGKVRFIKQEEVGAWGWCLYPFDGYFRALKDLDHESNDIAWCISADNIGETEVDADCITITDDDIIIKYVDIPVNEPLFIAASYDGKIVVESCYGDGYLVNGTKWYTCIEEALGEIEDYENNQD